MFKFLSNQGTNLVKKSSSNCSGYSRFLTYIRPTLAAAAIFATCTTGIAYYFYKKDVEAYEEKKKIALKKLEEQFNEDKSEFIEFENLIIELKERIKNEKLKFIEQQELDELSLSFSRQFEKIDEEFGIETSILSQETVLKIFDALFYLMKDNIHGYGYSVVIRKFREKRRDIVKDIRFAFNLNDITSEQYSQYSEICALESTVLNQIVIKALNRILKLIDLKKQVFDRSFLILSKTEDSVRNLMKDTFTRLTSSMKSEETEEELKERGSIDVDTLLKILEYRLRVYPKLSMFNELEPGLRKLTRLKFMADIIYFMYRLEDEDLFIRDPERKNEENQLHMNPKLKKIANKIQDLLQANI